MEDWLTLICSDFKNHNILNKRYLIVDLSTQFDSEWYFNIIKNALDITIADIYKYNTGTRNLSRLQLYDHVSLNLIDEVTPIIYFVDIVGSLENNKLWCHLRDIKKDIVIDKNGNIAFLSDVNQGNY